jgi:predicted nucleic acid-binding protein
VIVLDAGVVIAALDGADVHADAARALFEEHAASLIHPVNLGEALVRMVPLGQERTAARQLVQLGVQRAVLGDDHSLHLARLRAAGTLKMPDCCALVCAEEHELPLATFDRRLAEVARARGVTVLP